MSNRKISEIIKSAIEDRPADMKTQVYDILTAKSTDVLHNKMADIKRDILKRPE